MMNDRICIGKIVAAHGIRGEVKVQSQTKIPTDVEYFYTAHPSGDYCYDNS